jgi:hypothetical protein
MQSRNKKIRMILFIEILEYLKHLYKKNNYK